MKKSKKLLLLTFIFACVGFVFLSNSGDASAYSGTKTLNLNSQWPYAGKAYMHVRDSGSTIYSTFEPAYHQDTYVTASVQRYVSGNWKTIESKSGTARYGWGVKKQNFNATFYGYANKNQKVRVRYTLRGSKGSSVMQTGYSYSWTK
ncbi:hypothetical protein [Terribacillus sp. AE2B 122]|uniref:hypothetical protein n=1 Tax=Terribacillus sp. AE2B 122 TaxID=1331902 RepID=UPI001581F69E|nr:hypothetical protein [Terribacillus sp. AE2B 122]